MSNCTEGANEGEAHGNPHAHDDEIVEALVRDAELDADPALAISLEQLDEKIRERVKFGRDGRS